MKITCEYCGNIFDDTLEKCPGCAAPNRNVRRSTVDQPTTIEGLKEWYKSKGLPPAETTRFFIGVDYRDPRAFGIYKDENTGHFIVYKNKSDGSRAVRYEGSDEAYAVNEILMRLKQEILEQKELQNQKGTASATAQPSRAANSEAKQNNSGNTTPKKSNFKSPDSGNNKPKSGKGLLIAKILIPVFILIIAIAGIAVIGYNIKERKEYEAFMASQPQIGYYRYNNIDYCHFEHFEDSWATYNDETDNWEISNMPPSPELELRESADPYYLGSEWNSNLSIPDYFDTLMYKDKHSYYYDGYYLVDNRWYYRFNYYDNWFFYDYDKNDWVQTEYDNLPEALQHKSLSEEYHTTPDWDSETQIYNFYETDFYLDYLAETDPKLYKEYYSNRDKERIVNNVNDDDDNYFDDDHDEIVDDNSNPDDKPVNLLDWWSSGSSNDDDDWDSGSNWDSGSDWDDSSSDWDSDW